VGWESPHFVVLNNVGPGFVIPLMYGYKRICNVKLATKYPWLFLQRRLKQNNLEHVAMTDKKHCSRYSLNT